MNKPINPALGKLTEADTNPAHLLPTTDGTGSTNDTGAAESTSEYFCADKPPTKAELPERNWRKPDHVYVYRNVAGLPIFATLRWDKRKGHDKCIRPFRPERGSDGVTWVAKHIARPRPLYHVDLLAQHPTRPVLIVEGEGVADCAQAALLSWGVTVTWAGGAGSAHLAGWSPLRGRHVIIWRDADEAGEKAQADIIGNLQGVAASVRVVDLKLVAASIGSRLRRGWDLADAPAPWIAEHLSSREALAALCVVTPARVVPNQQREASDLPSGFFRTSDGDIWYGASAAESDDGQDHGTPICGPLRFISRCRDQHGDGWGLYLGWKDHDGREHAQHIGLGELAGDGTAIRSLLLGGGLTIRPGRAAADRFSELLSGVAPLLPSLVSVSKTGWHGDRYVLPDRCATTVPESGEPVIPTRSLVAQCSTSVGTLAEWQRDVSVLCVGNSRLVFSASCAFAGPLMRDAKVDGGGFNLRGDSSTGKTRCARVAESVFGVPERSWRGTINGLEATCLSANDGLLVLDEIGQADPRDIGACAYMIANGTAKARMSRLCELRDPATWRVLLLSTGEVSLATLSAEGGKVLRAGADLRIADVPADAGAGLGVFEQTHDTAGDSPKACGAAFADRITRVCQEQNGTAGPAFVRWYVANLPRLRGELAPRLDALCQRMVPVGSDGQVHRVARRFALAAVAGELATEAGITGWPVGEAERAALTCFQAWLGERPAGGAAAEDEQAVERVCGWLLKHGPSRFEAFNAVDADAERPVVNRAGWRRRVDGRVEYLIPAMIWKDEVCAGLDPKRAARAMKDAGRLRPDGDGKMSQSIMVPGEGKRRLYVVAVGDE